ncbi:MAG: RNase adapter RapZ [Desulfovibrio sp.]|jgi:UPF0042 nucleotide-binding protein|nr:RNase adapter RapZ [Desulfovibrio sp.]
MEQTALHPSFPVIVVTGLSGSGKSSALDVFEDMGFFTVDGLPAILAVQMITMVAATPLPHYRGLVVGMDLRQEGFVKDYEQALTKLRQGGHTPVLIFFEAKADILVKRYATTRRPHPLEKEGLGLEQALEEERARLSPLHKAADVVIDTSDYSIHDLRRILQVKWRILENRGHLLRVHVISFGFKYGTPAEADILFDLRFLPNPYFIPDLKPLSGTDAPVAEYVLEQEPGRAFLSRLTDFLEYLLAQFEKEGRFRLAIALGCTGGRHRSVAVAEALTRRLHEAGYAFSLEHRHLNLG